MERGMRNVPSARLVNFVSEASFIECRAVAKIFGLGGQDTSEASAPSPPQAIFFWFLPRVKPLDAIWQ